MGRLEAGLLFEKLDAEMADGADTNVIGSRSRIGSICWLGKKVTFTASDCVASSSI
jgi:hypothetical protein